LANQEAALQDALSGNSRGIQPIEVGRHATGPRVLLQRIVLGSQDGNQPEVESELDRLEEVAKQAAARTG